MPPPSANVTIRRNTHRHLNTHTHTHMHNTPKHQIMLWGMMEFGFLHIETHTHISPTHKKAQTDRYTRLKHNRNHIYTSEKTQISIHKRTRIYVLIHTCTDRYTLFKHNNTSVKKCTHTHTRAHNNKCTAKRTMN